MSDDRLPPRPRRPSCSYHLIAAAQARIPVPKWCPRCHAGPCHEGLTMRWVSNPWLAVGPGAPRSYRDDPQAEPGFPMPDAPCVQGTSDDAGLAADAIAVAAVYRRASDGMQDAMLDDDKRRATDFLCVLHALRAAFPEDVEAYRHARKAVRRPGSTLKKRNPD